MTKPFSYEDAIAPAAPASAGFSYEEASGEAAKPKQNKGLASDVLTAVKQGALQLPGVATGILDIAPGALGIDRPASKAADFLGSMTGFQPGKWAKEANAEYSPETQQAKSAVDQAWDDPNKGAADVAAAYLQNPRTIGLAAAQSVPSMLAGGLVGRGLGMAAGINSAAARAAIGEGAVMAGSTMDQIDESVDPQKAAAASLVVGAGGAAIGAGGAKIASRFGNVDIDSAIAGGVNAPTGKTMSLAKRVPAGILQEGLLEEAPQSALETGAQNWADGKPLTEGMARNVTEGALAGGLMGGGAAALTRQPQEQGLPDPDAGQPPAQPPAPALGYNPKAGTHTVFPDGTVVLNSETPAGEQAVFDKRFAPQQVTPTFAAAMNTDNVYQGWSNVRDGSDRQAMADQIAFAEKTYGGRVNDANIKEVATELATQFKWFRAATPQQKVAALNALRTPQPATPSQAMGIDPNAGVLSRTAAEAVDGPASMEAAVLQAERDMAALDSEDNPEAGADPQTPATDPLIAQVAGYVAEMGTASPQMVAAKFGVTTQRATELLAQADPTVDDLFPPPQGASNVSNTDAAGALAAGAGGAVGADATGGRPDAGLLAPAAGSGPAGDTGAPGPAVQEGDAAPVPGRDSDKALTKGPTQTKAKVKGLKDVIARNKAAKANVQDQPQATAPAAAPAPAPAVQAPQAVGGDGTAQPGAAPAGRAGVEAAGVGRPTDQVYVGKSALFDGFGASTGSLVEGSRRQLMVDPAGGFFWGDWNQTAQRDTGAVSTGADKDAMPASFPTGKEAREAAASTPPTKTAPAATPSPTTTEPTNAPRSPEAAQAVETKTEGREEAALLSNSVSARPANVPPEMAAGDAPELAERWSTMTAEQRQEVAHSAGWSTAKGTVNVVGKAIARKSWADQAPSTRKRLADVMKASPPAEAPAAPAVAAPAPSQQAQAPAAAPAVQPTVDQAANEAATSPSNDLPEPTQAQKEAGNYKKGHVQFDGLDLTVENPVGSTRSGTDPSGKPWEVTMTAHYGYHKRTTGADGDQVDVYLADNPVAGSPVFVFDQFNADGSFDEHKAVAGVATEAEAIAIYDAHFSDGSGPKRRRTIKAMTPAEFKAWAMSDAAKQPLGIKFSDGQQLAAGDLLTYFDQVVAGSDKGEKVVNPRFQIGEVDEATAQEISKYIDGYDGQQRRLRVSGRTLKHIYESRPAIAREIVEQLPGMFDQPDEVLPDHKHPHKRALLVKERKAEDGQPKPKSYVATVEVEIEVEVRDGFIDIVTVLTAPERSLKAARELKESWAEGQQRTEQAVNSPHPLTPKEGANPAADSPDTRPALGSLTQPTQEAQADTPKLTQAEAKELMEWVDLGQKDGIKTHILTFYESKVDKDAKRGRMTIATVSKEVDSKTWVLESNGEKYAMLGFAKKRAEEAGMAKAVADGYVEAAAAAPEVPKKGLGGAREVPVIDKRAPAAAGVADNFGEELPPARRTMATKLSEDLTDDKIASLPLSQIWPTAENEAIEDVGTAAAAHVMREAIPAKPRVAYKVKAWVEKVKFLRDFAAKIVRGDISRDRLMEEMQKVYALRDLAAKIKLLEQIYRAQWKRIGDVSEAPNAIRYVDGQKTPSPYVMVTVDGRSRSIPGQGNVLDHLDGIKAMLGDGAPEAKMQFEIRQEGRGERKVFINKKGDKEYRRLMEFATVDEARKALKEQYADLVAAWEGVKGRDNITERDLRSDTNRDRTGKDHRKGRDVTAEEFESKFGFRGGEFGKWVGQGKGAQERQFMLNSAYDALMDLSDLLGIPPKAISLEGSLGIAFGSRGSGWASAHFEPSNLVINLTKTRGAGALAHEWFHALDNYFARKRNGGEVPIRAGSDAQSEYRRNNYITHKTSPMMVRKDGRGSPVTKERLVEWRKSSADSAYLAPENWMEDPNHKQGVRAEVEQAFADLVKTLNDTPMLKRARRLDGVKDAEGYWSRMLEMAARSFENYVQTRMMEQGYHNDFLANVKEAPEVGKNVERYPYLLPSEIAPVADAFKALFDTIQTKQDDAGNVALFSQSLAPVAPGQGVTRQQAEEVVEKALDALGMRGVVTPQVVQNTLSAGLGATPPEVVPSGGNARGQVYLFLDGLADQAEAFRVVFHELFHLGLSQSVKPAEYTQTMLQFLRDPLVREYANRWKQSADGKNRLRTMPMNNWHALAVEEALADIAEEMNAESGGIGTKDMQGWVKRTIAWLADTAQKWGLPAVARRLRGMTYTQAEAFVQATMLKARTGAPTLLPDTRFAQADDVRSANFRKWFGDSKVVDADGKPLVVYHGTQYSFNAFDPDMQGDTVYSEDVGFFFTNDPKEADAYATLDWDRENPKPNVMPVYLSVKNPKIVTLENEQSPYENPAIWYDNEGRDAAQEAMDAGQDGLIVIDNRDDMRLADGKKPTIYIAFRPEQVKSAIGNNGQFDPENSSIVMRSPRELAGMATDQLKMTLTAPGKLSWWSKTVGTMYGLAERHPAFKPVFNAAQSFIDDVSYYATDAADMAPKMLPKLENWRDIAKSPISAEDNKAIEAPVNEGTLLWARDESGRPVKVAELEAQAADMTADQKARRLLRNDKISEGVLRMWQGLPQEQYEKLIDTRYESQMLTPGVVWADAELKAIWKLNDAQIGLYREVRAAIDKSLDNLAKSDLVRFVGKDGAGIKDAIMEADSVDAAALLARDYFIGLSEAEPDRAEMLLATANGVMDRADKVTRLKEQGYAPLSRFGKYTVDVVTEEGRQYFGLFESMREANQMAARMRGEFGKDAVSQGTLSDESFKLFQGITPETLELFGNMLGLSDTGDTPQDQAFQAYLKLTKNNRSAMKRLIQRKGILGYSQDVGRVLASFIYSNARQTAGALHIGDLTEAVNAIPQSQGELKDEAVRLAEYIQNPQEEAQAFRGLLFAQYLGGSIASAMVNMTQPLQVSFPYLSQFGGATAAGKELMRAIKGIATGKKDYEPDLARALKHAEDDGTVSPQEVHQLQAQARGAGTLRSGDGTRMGDALAKGGNAWAKMSLAWGKVFGVAEQMNRRSTFIAAYRLAKAQKMADPAGFAKKAVHETQFIYSKANKMRWGRGAIGGVAMTFKTYSVAYLELLHRMATQGGPEGKRAAMLAVAVLLVMGGAGGLPFMEDAEDITDAIAQVMGYNFSTKQAKQELLQDLFGEAAGQFIERGVSGLPGVPLDVTGRLGMGNLIPGTGLFLQKNSNTRDVLEIAGPAGDLAQRVMNAGGMAVRGNLGGAALELSPKALRDLAKGADMADKGMYRDAKGFKVLDTTPVEAGLKAIGFQPNTVAQVQEGNYLMQRQKDFYNATAQSIRAKWARGLFEKDEGMVAEAREAIDAWNEKNPDQRMSPNMPAIWRRVREMAKDKDQRIADTAPKAMRQQFREETARVRESL